MILHFMKRERDDIFSAECSLVVDHAKLIIYPVSRQSFSMLMGSGFQGIEYISTSQGDSWKVRFSSLMMDSEIPSFEFDVIVS